MAQRIQVTLAGDVLNAPLSINSSGSAQINANRTNISQPVNTLPFEILVSIFSLCQPQGTKSSLFRKNLHPQQDDYSWIALTHVCQHWRDVAVNCAALWQSIHLNTTNPYCGSIAIVFFERSNPLPIELNHTHDDMFPLMFPSQGSSQRETALMKKFYKLLLKNPNRIKDFHLQLDAYTFLDVEALLSLPLPNLVSLQLWLPPSASDHDELPSISDLDFENAPNLQRLSLHYFYWFSSAFPQLTHLYLSRDAHAFFRTMEYCELIGVLESCSDTLVAFALDDAGPVIDEPSDISAERRIIRMPGLENIELYPGTHPNENSYMLLFLHDLLLPEMATITWDSSLTHFNGDDEDLNEDSDEDDITDDDCYRLPSAVSLSPVTNLVIRSIEKEGCYTLQGNTLTANLSREDIWLKLRKISRFLPTLSTLTISNVSGIMFLDNVVASVQHRAITSLHLPLHRCLPDFIIELEAHSQYDDESDGYAGDDESEGEDNGEKVDTEIGDEIDMSPLLPLLSTLTIYTGNRPIDGLVQEFSSQLRAHRLPELTLSDNLSMDRLRQPLLSYALMFRPCAIEDIVL